MLKQHGGFTLFCHCTLRRLTRISRTSVSQPASRSDRNIGSWLRKGDSEDNVAETHGLILLRTPHFGPKRKKADNRKRLPAKNLQEWAGVDLNHRHTDFQSVALPTELPARQDQIPTKET